jgi:hypothetical protein
VSSDLVASAVDDALTTGPSSVTGRQDFAMCRVKAPLIAAFEGSMGGDEHAVFEDADLVGEYVNIEDTATCRIGRIRADQALGTCAGRLSIASKTGENSRPTNGEDSTPA